MGLRMARLELTDAAGRDGVVVPVATTRSRKRRRGYNQAERLARIVAGERRMPLHDALVRTGRSRTQVSLHPTQRRANVENVFRVRPERAASLVGRPVLLIDDVLTTGATVQSAAQALLKAGSGDVTAVTFARALPFRAAPLG